jgi:hypothetical protein
MKFFEVSAKTNENVKEAFDSLISQAATPMNRLLFVPLSPASGTSSHDPRDGASHHSSADSVSSTTSHIRTIEDYCPTFDDDVDSCRPMIYRDLASILVPQSSQLSDYGLLMNRFGHKMVSVSLLEEDSYSRPPFAKTSITLREYFEKIMNSPAFHSASSSSSLLALTMLRAPSIPIDPSSPSSPSSPHKDVTPSAPTPPPPPPRPSSRPGSRPTSASFPPPLFYLQQVNLSKYLPEMLRELRIPRRAPFLLSSSKETLSENYCYEPTFFVGVKGVKTSLHYDLVGGIHPRKTKSTPHSSSPQKNTINRSPLKSFWEKPVNHEEQKERKKQEEIINVEEDPGKYNLFAQVSGKRKFILFSPEYYSDLLPDLGSSWPHVSRTTVFFHSVGKHSSVLGDQMDFIRRSEFPSLATPWFHRQEYILSHGDVFLIPPKWWYISEVLETGTALNWSFFTEREMMKMNPKVPVRAEGQKKKKGVSHPKPHLKEEKCVLH